MYVTSSAHPNTRVQFQTRLSNTGKLKSRCSQIPCTSPGQTWDCCIFALFYCRCRSKVQAQMHVLTRPSGPHAPAHNRPRNRRDRFDSGPLQPCHDRGRGAPPFRCYLCNRPWEEQYPFENGSWSRPKRHLRSTASSVSTPG